MLTAPERVLKVVCRVYDPGTNEIGCVAELLFKNILRVSAVRAEADSSLGLATFREGTRGKCQGGQDGGEMHAAFGLSKEGTRHGFQK